MFNKDKKKITYKPIDVKDILADPNPDRDLPMELQLKIKEHARICDYIHNLYKTKNRDYGDSMHPLYEEYGLTAFMVLFGIKIQRIKSLMEKGSATYESLEDSLLDLANYAMIAVTELRAEKRNNTIKISNPSNDELMEAITNSATPIVTQNEK